MATYIIRPFDGPDFAIKAERYYSTGDVYDFYNGVDEKRTLVASVNVHSTLAVFEEDAFEGIIDDEDDSDDTCLDCRFQEFLESENFFSEVFDIITAWHEPDEPEPETVYQANTPISEGSWGFWYHDEKEGDLFVPFGRLRSAEAEAGLVKHKEGKRDWFTHPLSETTPVPETIQ